MSKKIIRIAMPAELFITTIFSSLIVVFFSGCGIHYVNRFYTNNTFQGSSLFVCPVSTEEIHISDSTIIDFLKKDYHCRDDSCLKVLRGLFYNAVQLQSENWLAELRPAWYQGSLDSFETAFRNCPKKNAGYYSFRIPSEEMLSSYGISSRFLLILQHLDLDISSDVSVDVDLMNDRYVADKVTVTDNKRYEFDADDMEFLVWDREKKQDVAYGNFDHSSAFGRCGQNPVLDGKECDNSVFWTFHFGELVKTALLHTPFGIHKIDRKKNKEIKE